MNQDSSKPLDIIPYIIANSLTIFTQVGTPIDPDTESDLFTDGKRRRFYYPDLSRYDLFKQFREQRLTTVHFWNLLQEHSFSLFTFNNYIHQKYSFLSFI